jgi:hypothetical protein
METFLYLYVLNLKLIRESNIQEGLYIFFLPNKKMNATAVRYKKRGGVDYELWLVLTKTRIVSPVDIPDQFILVANWIYPGLNVDGQTVNDDETYVKGTGPTSIQRGWVITTNIRMYTTPDGIKLMDGELDRIQRDWLGF